MKFLTVLVVVVLAAILWTSVDAGLTIGGGISNNGGSGSGAGVGVGIGVGGDAKDNATGGNGVGVEVGGGNSNINNGINRDRPPSVGFETV